MTTLTKTITTITATICTLLENYVNHHQVDRFELIKSATVTFVWAIFFFQTMVIPSEVH